MNPIYFRITEPPDFNIFDDAWHEIPATQNQFFLGRALWQTNHVSRFSSECAAIRFDLQYKKWEMKNNAPGRVVILDNGTARFELLTTMSTELGPGRWTGTLTEAFTFEIVHDRPPGRIVYFGEPDPSLVVPNDVTVRRRLAVRAKTYLEKHPLKRAALAYMWRQHIEHTSDLAEDLNSNVVGKAFKEASSTITGWREELAAYVYEERGHQHLIRDLIIKHRLMTRKDVEDALTRIERLAQTRQRNNPGSEPSTTRRPQRGR